MVRSRHGDRGRGGLRHLVGRRSGPSPPSVGAAVRALARGSGPRGRCRVAGRPTGVSVALMGGELERAGSVERMITLDTGAVASLVLRDGPQHASAVRALAEAREPVVVPLPILAEIDRVLSELASGDAMAALLDGIQRGDTLLDCGDLDLPRIRQLMTAYRDLGLAG